MQDLCGHHRFFRKKDSEIGSGVEAIVYEACSYLQVRDKKKSCRFVVKELPLYAPTAFDEIAARMGYGPFVVVDRCVKDNKTYLIQERLDGTLEDFLEKKKSGHLSKTEKDALSRLVYDSIDKMHVFHGDLHAQNVMYKAGPGGKVRFYLIDFSQTEPIDATGYKMFDFKLDVHTMVKIGGGSMEILTAAQKEALSKKHRPSTEFTAEELDAKRKRQAILQAARQTAAKALRQRMQAMSKKK